MPAAEAKGEAKLREDGFPASQSNQILAMDFVHDRLAMGKKIRVLTVVDIFSKFSPVNDPKFSYRAKDVRTLERISGEVGYPKTIRVDQGSAFVSRSLSLFLCQQRRYRLLKAWQTD